MERYILAVLPPQDIGDFVGIYKEKYSGRRHHALPPHITIYPPFYNRYSTETELVVSLRDAFTLTKPGRVNFDSIGYFSGDNNVVYLQPDQKSSEYLLEIFTAAATLLSDNSENFHPHVTIVKNVPLDELSSVKKKLEAEQINLSFLV